MAEPITLKILKGVGVAIAEYAFGKVGDNFFDTMSVKRKIKKILKKDKEYITKQFENHYPFPDIDVEMFLFHIIFQDSMFLYPVSNIPEDRSKLLWEKFCTYAKEYDGAIKHQSFEHEYRFKLEECINNHNRLVNEYILSESERIILKTMHRNQSDLLGYIGKTLDSNSELQFNDSKLDYTHKQIEALLHALRMDMRHYKLLLILYSIGIIIIEAISIIMLPKLFSAISAHYGLIISTIIIILSLTLVLLFLLLSSTMSNIRKCERRITAYMESLWNLHFKSYVQQYKATFRLDSTLFDDFINI